MKNIGRGLLSSVCAVALIANSVAGVITQGRKNDGKAVVALTRPEIVDMVEVAASDPTGGAPRGPEVFNGGFANAAQQGGDGAFQFFSQEMSFDNRLVKGAPFSADIVSETIQTLPDGNRIVQRSEGRIYRDSQGRTRNERTYQMGGSSEQRQVINILDPVAGSGYSLNPETRIARKNIHFFAPVSDLFLTPPFNPNAPSHLPRGVPSGVPGGVPGGVAPPETTPATPAKPIQPKKINVAGEVLQGAAIKKVPPPYPPIAKAARVSGAVQVLITINENGGVIEANAISGHPLLRDAALQAARQWLFKPTEIAGVAVKVQGILTFNFTLNDEEPVPDPYPRSAQKYTTNTEQLGKQMVEGVECEGTRSVTTMPAGAIGNERPIETVNETWHSPELKMTILSKRSDPRFGESTYRVTNIIRSEPDAALFQIPSEYTIIDGRSRKVEELEEMRRKLKERSEGARKPNNQ
jgi:TonB family protein